MIHIEAFLARSSPMPTPFAPRIILAQNARTDLQTLARASSTRPCTCTLRINATDSLVDLRRTKRSIREGAHGLPAALSPLVTPSQPAVRTHVVCSGSLPVPLPTPSACSHPRWLWPRRHPIQQDLSQCPDMIGQPGCHRGCPGAPVLRGARPVGGQGLGLGLA